MTFTASIGKKLCQLIKKWCDTVIQVNIISRSEQSLCLMHVPDNFKSTTYCISHTVQHKCVAREPIQKHTQNCKSKYKIAEKGSFC